MALNNSPSLKFVPPPVRTLTFPKYATYIPHLAEMKSHTWMSAVKNRINYQCRRSEALPGQEDVPYYQKKYREFYREAYILENVGGEWFTLYHIKEGTEPNDLPWMVDVWTHKQYGWKYDQEPNYNPENYVHKRIAKPMATEDYINWRIKAELERRGITE